MANGRLYNWLYSEYECNDRGIEKITTTNLREEFNGWVI